MDISLLALWFVCALGAAVFAAAGARTRAAAVTGVLAFVVGAWWVRQPFAPVTAAVGLGVTLMAVAELIRSPGGPSAMSVAGLLAGFWSGVLQYQGVPMAAAVIVAGSLPIASAELRVRRAEFAPAPLREEALLFVVILGLVAASAPGISEGWRAATNLNLRGGEGQAADALPMWALAVASAALLSGGLFSVWGRR